MKQRFRILQRAGGVFYLHDNQTGRRKSLETTDKVTAQRLLSAQNAAHEQPILNLQLARTYLSATNPEIVKRTWQQVFDEIIKTKRDNTADRWTRAASDISFDSIKSLPLFETQSHHFLKVLEVGTVSTNVYLRRLHNFALDMNWLLAAVLPKKQWPPVHFGEKRAITFEEHERIIEIEWDCERKAYYQLLWHLGGSQSDVAALCAEDIQWNERAITYARQKTKGFACIHFSEEGASILKGLPRSGPLFPRLSRMHEKHRAAEFKRRCTRLKIEGITLHSYRYSWAERAKTCGYPERFAMVALGHNSKAVHRAYSKKAQVMLPALDEYEKQAVDRKIVPFQPKANSDSARGDNG